MGKHFSSMRCMAMCLVLAATLLPGVASAVLPFDDTGNLYVSMFVADEIAVFTPEGEALERFTTEGLDGPRGIAFNPANGEIWIASEFGDAIFIFDHAHQFLRRLDHPDFNEPVGVSFASVAGVDASEQMVYISNSNANEIMVFDQAGNLQRRFSGTAVQDPNCSAFMPDGGFYVTNRLGGTMGTTGAVSAFDSNDVFAFDFTTDGIVSLMAVALDHNTATDTTDDTLWVTSGGGDTGIYEFDLSGNLLTSLLPNDIDDGRSIVPQGIAFDSTGSFYVVSFSNEVLKFDGDGNFQMRFPTGSGTSRSTAFQGCQSVENGQCAPFGASLVGGSSGGPGGEIEDNQSTTVPQSIGGGGGLVDWMLLGLLGTGCWRRRPMSIKNAT